MLTKHCERNCRVSAFHSIAISHRQCEVQGLGFKIGLSNETTEMDRQEILLNTYDNLAEIWNVEREREEVPELRVMEI